MLLVSILMSPSGQPTNECKLGVHLTGSLSGWATPKDLILHLAGKLTVRVSLFLINVLLPWMFTHCREGPVGSWSTLGPVCSASLAQVSQIISFYDLSQLICICVLIPGLATVANMVRTVL